MSFFYVRKKVHWSDCDAAGIAWFPNYLGWFEDVEEELFVAALGHSRQSLLLAHRLGMPRVEAHITYAAPVRIGTCLRVGVDVRVENPRRMRHVFEMDDEATGTRVASGFVRVASVDIENFSPRDFPPQVLEFALRIQALAERQASGDTELPWA